MYEYVEHKDYEKLFNIHNLNAKNQKKKNADYYRISHNSRTRAKLNQFAYKIISSAI